MNAVLAAARASIASDGRETSTSSGRSRVRRRAEQVADRLDRAPGRRARRRSTGCPPRRTAPRRPAKPISAVLSSRGRERDRVEDPDHGEPAPADPHARAGVVDAERGRRLGAEHDGRVARRSRRSGTCRAAASRRPRRAAAGSAATTLIPPVSASSTNGLRRTVCAGDGRGRGDRLARRRRARIIAADASGSTASSPKNDWPGATRSRFVPSWSSSASRSAFEDSEMPSTATIDATPIAIPSADSAARARRVRRPSAPVRRTSRGGHSSSPSRSSTRRGNASAIAWSCVIVTIVEPAACSSCSSARMPAPRAAVEVAGRLVGEHDRRPADQRPRDRDPLALAAGELRRRVLRAGARGRPPRAPRAPARAARRGGTPL